LKICGVANYSLDIDYKELLQIFEEVANQVTDFWLGINLQGRIFPHEVFATIPAHVMPKVKGVWVDNAEIDERKEINDQDYPKRVTEYANKHGFKGYVGWLVLQFN
jgi:hypothetical protein